MLLFYVTINLHFSHSFFCFLFVEDKKIMVFSFHSFCSWFETIALAINFSLNAFIMTFMRLWESLKLMQKGLNSTMHQNIPFPVYNNMHVPTISAKSFVFFSPVFFHDFQVLGIHWPNITVRSSFKFMCTWFLWPLNAVVITCKTWWSRQFQMVISYNNRLPKKR